MPGISLALCPLYYQPFVSCFFAKILAAPLAKASLLRLLESLMTAHWSLITVPPSSVAVVPRCVLCASVASFSVAVKGPALSAVAAGFSVMFPVKHGAQGALGLGF